MRDCRYRAIVEDDRILLIEHRVRESGRGYWVPPGRRIEAGESEEQCVRREVLEETGLDLDAAPFGDLMLRRLAPQRFPQVQSQHLDTPEHDEARKAEQEPAGQPWLPS